MFTSTPTASSSPQTSSETSIRRSQSTRVTSIIRSTVDEENNRLSITKRLSSFDFDTNSPTASLKVTKPATFEKTTTQVLKPTQKNTMSNRFSTYEPEKKEEEIKLPKSMSSSWTPGMEENNSDCNKSVRSLKDRFEQLSSAS